MRIGHGYDVHAFDASRACIIGGVTIDYHLGLKGHSDADVLLHAIMDAIIGALALGDIGGFFPDDDPQYKNIDSMFLLEQVVKKMFECGYEIGNLDATIVAQGPKMKAHIPMMRKLIAETLKTDVSNISIKATTEEKLGFTGRLEGIKAHAVVIIKERTNVREL